MSTTWQSLFNSGQACGADWQHAIILHPAQDRGSQQDCCHHPQPAGQQQRCCWLLLCRAGHALCQYCRPFPGQAFLVTCTCQSLLLHVAGCTKMCIGPGPSCRRLYVEGPDCTGLAMVNGAGHSAGCNVDNTTDHVSSVLDLPVSSSRTPSSLSDDPTAMMCRWKSLQQWVHQSSRLSCCKRPTTPSRLLWSKLPCMVRHTPRADTLILCTSCVFTGSVDDCRHQSYVLRLPAHALVILLKCLYKASSAKVLSPRLSSSRLATHF